jgi:hypothetical protein
MVSWLDGWAFRNLDKLIRYQPFQDAAASHLTIKQSNHQ